MSTHRVELLVRFNVDGEPLAWPKIAKLAIELREAALRCIAENQLKTTYGAVVDCLEPSRDQEETVENQLKITGYRDLSAQEIEVVNEVKRLSQRVGDLVDGLARNPDGLDIDARWVSVGKTHLQQGFMALVRSVTRPTSF